MVHFRQIASVGWTLMAFMVAGALVLHLRYRPVAEDSLLLDTWTGQVHEIEAPRAVRSDAGRGWQMEGRLLELEARLRRAQPATCARVRFAFPAPPADAR